VSKRSVRGWNTVHTNEIILTKTISYLLWWGLEEFFFNKTYDITLSGVLVVYHLVLYFFFNMKYTSKYRSNPPKLSQIQLSNIRNIAHSHGVEEQSELIRLSKQKYNIFLRNNTFHKQLLDILSCIKPHPIVPSFDGRSFFHNLTKVPTTLGFKSGRSYIPLRVCKWTPWTYNI